MCMDNLREKVDVVTGLYMDLLKVEGKLHQLFHSVNHFCSPTTPQCKPCTALRFCNPSYS